MLLQDVQAREQLVQVRSDDVLDGHEPLRGDREEPGQQRGNLDPGEHRCSGPRVGDHDGQVERQAGDEGKRMRRVHDQRRQHRVDALAEQFPQVGPLVRGQLLPAEQLDAVGTEGGQNPVGEAGRMPRGQLARQLEGPVEHLARKLDADPLDREASRHPPHQASHPYHEKFVQVAGEYGQEPDALEQRDALVLGQLQDPLVEPEPAFLPVQVTLRGKRRKILGAGPRAAVPAVAVVFGPVAAVVIGAGVIGRGAVAVASVASCPGLPILRYRRDAFRRLAARGHRRHLITHLTVRCRFPGFSLRTGVNPSEEATLAVAHAPIVTGVRSTENPEASNTE